MLKRWMTESDAPRWHGSQVVQDRLSVMLFRVSLQGQRGMQPLVHMQQAKYLHIHTTYLHPSIQESRIEGLGSSNHFLET